MGKLNRSIAPVALNGLLGLLLRPRIVGAFAAHPALRVESPGGLTEVKLAIGAWRSVARP